MARVRWQKLVEVLQDFVVSNGIIAAPTYVLVLHVIFRVDVSIISSN